jgi:peptide/nickel transport system substrate-binding protein
MCERFARTLALFVLIALVTAGSGRMAAAQQRVKGGHLVMGLASDVMARGGLDPASEVSVPQHVVSMNLYDNLLFKDTDGTLRPGLAERWEVSPNGRIYTFHLRRGVVFHDGTPFNAEAVRFHLYRVLDKDGTWKSAWRAYLGPFKEAVVVNDYLIKVHFTEPFAPFINNIATYGFGIPSPTHVKKHGPGWDKNPVGSGPFKFAQLIQGQAIVLVRNENYKWPPKGMYVNKAPAYLEKITFRFIPEDVTRMGALETGEVNAVVNLSADGANRFRKYPGRYKISVTVVPSMPFAYHLNTKMFPTSELAVRQALNYAVDQKIMIEKLFAGVLAPGLGPLSPTIFGYSREFEEYYRQDLARARQILDRAGWQPGPGGIRVKDGKRLEIRAATLVGQRFQMAAEWIQALAKEVGIDFKIEIVDVAALLQVFRTGTHHAASIGDSGPDPDILRTRFHSSQVGTGNLNQLNDPELDAWLEEGFRETNKRTRLAIYFKIQKRIMDQALILPIYYPTHAFASLIEVKGLRMDGSGYYPLLFDTYVERR